MPWAPCLSWYGLQDKSSAGVPLTRLSSQKWQLSGEESGELNKTVLQGLQQASTQMYLVPQSLPDAPGACALYLPGEVFSHQQER